MKPTLLVLVVVGLAIAIAACNRKSHKAMSEATNRLSSRLKSRPDYLVLVGVPVDAPTKWARATSYSADEIITADGRISVASIRAFVIAYPNKQVLDAETQGLAIPDELDGLEPQSPEATVDIDASEALAGRRFVEVTYGPSATHPGDRDHYTTTLRNVGAEPVRVLKFGAFIETDGRYILNTVTGQFFSADELVSWYGAPADGWILPGTSVRDPDNYGSPPVLWAYYCETKSGQQFVTGAIMTGDKSQ